MSSQLSGIPVPKRRQLAATIGLFAMLFLAVGAVSLTRSGGGAGYTVFQVAAFVIAVLLAMVSWGVVTSVKNDLAEQKLDAAIAEVVGSRPDSLCSCGHEHDPTELHVVDAEPGAAADACAHDGGGAACAHDCQTCVLAALRPSAAASTATAERPSPRPRPRPTPTR
ncbi:MAG: hypothetical protein ACTHMS_21280 [Jatrophihabitans sp.]|uniref:hypothetical protein n=1 Tax=Jatrophihabitans sp. TaxID=1932789 RepID=UPI003F7CE48F